MVNQIKRIMRELSIEEKAKAYDEALEKAMNFIENGGITEQTVAKSIFQGVIENKDEKIRKSLVILLQHFCKGYRVPGLKFPVSFQDMLAWLEKKGEQNPAWSEEDERIINSMIRDFEIIAKGDLGKDCPLKTKTYIPWLKLLKDRYQLQAKQEWSEEDKRLFDLLHTCVCRCITDPYWDYEKRENISKNIPLFLDKLKTLKAQSQWKK